jgi:virginiamycin A acetyltransferase
MNAHIMRGVKIGDGAVIAAGGIVTKDVAPYSIVAGVPAQHIKYRFSTEVITALLKMLWWNWEDEILKKNIILFNNPELFVKEFDILMPKENDI